MKNLIDTKNLPYRIGSGIIWNDAGFKECLEKSKNSSFFREIIDIKNKKKQRQMKNFRFNKYEY